MDTTEPTTSADQAGLPEAVSESDLIAAIEGRSEVVGGVEALKELSRRRSNQKTPVLTRVVTDAKRPPDLRAAAALELGREQKAGHQEALMAAVRSRDVPVVRRAAEALGRVGDESALRALESLRPAAGPAQRSVQFAKTLISYRLGLESNRLKPPPQRELLSVEQPRAMPLRVEPLAPRALESLRANLRRELPAIPVSGDGAVRFSCGVNQFLIVFNARTHQQQTLEELERRSAVPVVVLKRSESLQRFYVYEYVLTHPERTDRLQLFATRTTGVTAHFGNIDLAGGQARFELRALNTPYSPPVEIEGSYDHNARRLTFARAVVSRDFDRSQRRPAAPTKLDVPIP